MYQAPSRLWFSLELMKGAVKKIAPTATINCKKRKFSFFLWLLVQIFFFTAPLLMSVDPPVVYPVGTPGPVAIDLPAGRPLSADTKLSKPHYTHRPTPCNHFCEVFLHRDSRFHNFTTQSFTARGRSLKFAYDGLARARSAHRVWVSAARAHLGGDTRLHWPSGHTGGTRAVGR